MLKVTDLHVTFQNKHHLVKAVDGISFEIKPHHTVGLVGESGSGKSVTALSLLKLLPHTNATLTGKIMWQGQDLHAFSDRQMRAIRGSQMGLIFQNPQAALNPVFSVGYQMIETIRQHHTISKSEAQAMAIRLLNQVQIPDAETRFWDYPHQFSIGMCQRIMIALTLSMRPQLLIADEPTASLDVTIQAQILELLERLKAEYQMSLLLISHDLGVIAQHCDDIMVMYLGRIVEQGTPKQIFHHSQHPYTQALIAAIPVADPSQPPPRVTLKGDVPSLMKAIQGCRFHPRCQYAFDRCRNEAPVLMPTAHGAAACWLVHK